jgi:hypothetical protein
MAKDEALPPSLAALLQEILRRLDALEWRKTN